MALPTQDDLARVVEARGISDPRVLEAFRLIPREEFVAQESRELAYYDEPIPIGEGQVTTQPSLVAQMVEALGLEGSEKVLEIGTGYGFQTALLAHLADQVFSIERFEDIAVVARRHLEQTGVSNAVVIVGDGSRGLPEEAPFDAILVSAAYPEPPKPFEEQLTEGGRLVQPLGRGGNEDVVLFQKTRGRLRSVRSLTGARFVRLVGEHGFER